MTYAPVITPTGISAPTYAQILAALQAAARSIFGSDIDIAADTQDGQMLAIFADALQEENNAIIAAYNSFSPVTAQGVGLSSVVKINGIRRLVASNSQVLQRVTGVAGTVINNGQVADPNTTAVRWALPSVVVIPDAGFIDVTATAVDAGSTPASPATLTYIVTPVRNWQSTTNTAAATPGQPVEVDATLRQRQAVSTAIPALTVNDATLGAVKNLVGVGRATLYENDTGAADANGVPAHSIAVVVEGGDAQTIGDTIELYKTPGTGTYGTTAIPVVDPAGLPNTINFFELSLVDIGVVVFLDAETGYVSTTGDLIRGAMVSWFENLAIGQDSQWSKLWSPANLTGDAATAASGQTQAQLDVLSSTFNVTQIYQARTDNMKLTAQTNAASNVFHVISATNYAIGDKVAQVLDDGSLLQTIITNVAGLVITTLNNVPGGRDAPIGALLYVASDVVVAFTEAVEGTLANMLVEVN